MTLDLGNFTNPERAAAIAAAARGDFSALDASNARKRAEVDADLANLNKTAGEHAAHFADDPRIGQEFLRSAALAERLTKESLN